MTHSIINSCDHIIFVCFCLLIGLLPFSSGAVQFFTYLILLISVVRLCVQRPEIRLQPDFVDIAIFLWLGFSIVSILANPYPVLGWKGLLWKVLPGVALFYVFTQTMKDEQRIRWFLTSAFMGIFILCIDGVWQYVWGKDFIRHRPLFDGRVLATMKAPNSMAAYLMTFSPVLLMSVWACRGEAAFKLFGSSEKKSRIFLMFVFLLSVLCLGLTYSRGGWLAFSLAMAGLALADKRLRWLLLVLLVVFWVYFPQKMFVEREHMDATLAIAPFGREMFWTEAWNLIRGHWLFGAGLNAYSKAVQPYKISWGSYPHNCYLQMWAEIGILGVLSFLAAQAVLLFRAFQVCFKEPGGFQRNCLFGLAVGYTGFLFHSIFDTFFYSASLGILFWLMMAQIRVLSTTGKSSCNPS